MFKNNEEFMRWCNKNNLSLKAINLIESIRLQPPSRRVQGGAGNVCGFFNHSRKMTHSVQFESHTVELPFIYGFELDHEVIEYWEQVRSFYLDYRDKSGKRYRHTYTPDFFLIKKSCAGWVDTKTETALQKLSERFPDRYVKENEKWTSPAGERYASEFGLQFEVRSSQELNYVLQRNIQLLYPYFGREMDRTPAQRTILQVIGDKGFICLSELLEQARVEDMYSLISGNEVYVDLNRAFLGDAEHVTIYKDGDTADFHENLKPTSIESTSCLSPEGIRSGITVDWDSRVCKIVHAGQTSVLLQSDGIDPEPFSRKILEDQAREGKLRILQPDTIFNSNLDALLSTTSDAQRREAMRRMEIIQATLHGETNKEVPVCKRTVCSWLSKYRLAEKQYGNGFYGLIPERNRGNANDRLSAITNNDGKVVDVRNLLNDCIQEKYLNERHKRKSVVFSELVLQCQRNGLTPPSRKSFAKAFKRITREEEERARKGTKAAHQYEQFYFTLDQTVPVHGDRPWQITHLDHTQLDIELVDSASRQPVGRPWLTILIDAFSRRVLAFHITFVVDCGAEFGSRHFEMFLATYRINKKQRPPSKARFGSPVERFFGISNELFVHNLIGNTQIMRNVRQVSKATNPKRLSAWTLSSFAKAFGRWIEFYNNREHGTLMMSPNQAYEIAMQKHPVPYRRIEYDQKFLIDSMPSPRTGGAKVDGCRGIKVNYLYYWSNKLALPTVAGTRVEVRYDPFNLGIVYAYIKGHWEPCYSRLHYHEFKNHSESELKYAATEIRKRHLNHGRRQVPNAAEFARFFDEIQNNEQEEIQHRRNAEMKTRHENPVEDKRETEAFEIDLNALAVLNWGNGR